VKQDRLATVVRIRALQERIARAAVARDRMAVAEREQREQHALTSVDTRATQAPREARAFVAHRSMLHGGVREVAVARAAVDAARADLAGTFDTWSDAAQRLEGIERLDERVSMATEAETQRREGVELDDIVVMRWETTS
jgi:hypothetical protein